MSFILASNSPPPASETKKIKLAIQKEAPVRPKAIADLNFFPTTLGEKKKYRRPVYISESNPNNESTPFMNKIPESAVVTTTSTFSPTTNKKRVTFSEKLFEIREYEKNPEEWTIGVSLIYCKKKKKRILSKLLTYCSLL